jgi:hypothetical protein
VEWHRVRSLAESGDGATLFSGLTPEGKIVAREMVRHLTPIKAMVQRSTRDLLRKYREKGILKETICRRDPKPVWITFTPEEEGLYADIETYISDFYRRYEAKRVGLGFVMTIYRRRLTSSFWALEQSLARRLAFLKGQRVDPGFDDDDIEQDDLDFDIGEEIPEATAALYEEEIEFVEGFLGGIRSLPADSKLTRLLDDLKEMLKQRETVLVFTQYTDTMDYLRDHLKEVYGSQVACYSGRGGELWDGSVWKSVTKEEVKALFRSGTDVKILLGTEAMSEGLNLQTCGVLINFDMPWNPMRVEQRIGRIDRIGQQHEVVWIRNYFYENSIEAVVYRRLEHRIDWFETVVGHLQPILSQVGRVIQTLSMTAPTIRASSIDAEIKELGARIQEEEASGLRLDEYLDDQIEAESDIPPVVPFPELEALFAQSSRFGELFRPHPTILGAFVVEDGENKSAITFRPDAFDRYPDTLRLLTYGEPLLADLLARVPLPAASEDGLARLVRCDTGAEQLVAYFGLAATGTAPLETLTSVGKALGSPPFPADAEHLTQAEALLRRDGELLRTRARGVKEALAVGDLLARKEEARIILRRAFFVERTLQTIRQPDLFDDRVANEGPAPLPSGVREFARSRGSPYAPLLVLLGNEEIGVSLAEPYLLGLAGRPEKSLRGLEQSLREQAQDVLKRLSVARERAARLAQQQPELVLSTTVLK